MPDRMGEKVARAMFRQDHDEGWGAGETATKLIYLNNADAALDACHFEELVAALKRVLPMVGAPHDYTIGDVWQAQEKASALLAKVKEAGHG